MLKIMPLPKPTLLPSPSRIYSLQINASLNIGKRGKNYAWEKLDKLVEEARREKSSVSTECFNE